MDKLDFKKSDRQFYSGKPDQFEFLTVPPMPYLMIDGTGTPDSAPYAKSVAALYGLSYGLKFQSKTQLQKDWVVAPLQGLWWADDMDAFITDDKDQWKWTMMIRQPDWVMPEMLATVRDALIPKNAKKKPPPTDTDTIQNVRLETLDEGKCVQVLHVGSYSDEGPILKNLHHEFIPENGLAMTGKHHEIYLSDPRKIAPENLKTILRQPVQPNSNP